MRYTLLMNRLDWVLSRVPRTTWGKVVAVVATFLAGFAVGGLMIVGGYHG